MGLQALPCLENTEVHVSLQLVSIITGLRGRKKKKKKALHLAFSPGCDLVGKAAHNERLF